MKKNKYLYNVTKIGYIIVNIYFLNEYRRDRMWVDYFGSSSISLFYNILFRSFICFAVTYILSYIYIQLLNKKDSMYRIFFLLNLILITVLLLVELNGFDFQIQKPTTY